jgi:polysaccharide export outer membrane protein
MKRLLTLTFAMAVGPITLTAQQPAQAGRGAEPANTATESANLPVEKLGPDDLIGVAVYDSPELSRTIRVDAEGNIRLPMVRQRISVTGLYPYQLESAITDALIQENVLVHPVVTVSVVEYRSRPITVAGAVRSPTTFQATGTVTLLDAISRAGGIADNAGGTILVTHPAPKTPNQQATLIERIAVRALLSGDDPGLNMRLEGGEEIRVPEAGRVFVAGNVKHPGAYAITDGPESSVLKALALSEGLNSFSTHTAYIYRQEGGPGGKSEIPIDLKKILNRQAPDVPLFANDMLYVPSSAGKHGTALVLERTLAVGVGLAGILLLALR